MKEISCGTKKENEALNQKYWNERWEQRETGWDIGYPSPAIEKYLTQYKDKHAKILIPGCGNAYEAEFLAENGFSDITILDIAPHAVEILQKKFENRSCIKVIFEDFFEHIGQYDLIIEQTFFCAISPLKRKDYVRKTYELLKPGGKIVGLLFDRLFEKTGPPFGGSIAEYELLFNVLYHIRTMEKCTNSIESRINQEAFIILEKKR